MRRWIIASIVTLAVLSAWLAWPTAHDDGAVAPDETANETGDEEGLRDTPGLYYANATYEMPINFGVPGAYFASATQMLRSAPPAELTGALVEFHWTTSLPDPVPDCLRATITDGDAIVLELLERDSDGVARAWLAPEQWNGELRGTVSMPSDVCAVVEASPRIVVSMFVGVPVDPEHRAVRGLFS